MRKIALKATELSVAPLCLGTVNYGTAMPGAAAKRQLDQYAGAGGNFLDTAHVYGDWVPGLKGRSERVIGEWMRETGLRGQMVIATKGAHPRLDRMDVPRLRPEDLEADLQESLDCLGVDRIDLYFLHRDDPSIPVGEIIGWLSQKADEGCIRHYGCSNWTLARIQEADQYARLHRIKGFVCNQLMWSLAVPNRANFEDPSLIPMDADTYAYHARTGLSAMGYMSVAKGYFMRRQAGEQLPASVERMYGGARNDAVYAELTRLSRETGASLLDLCLLYFSGHPFAAIPIASFDTEEQLRAGLRFASIEWEEALPSRLHGIRGDSA